MRIVVISALPEKTAPADYAASLAKGMERMGHHVDIFDAWTGDAFRLPAYQYIAVVTRPVSVFSGNVPDIVSKILGAASGLAGKKSAAFVIKSGLRAARALVNLMREMEKEGMNINWSDILLNPPHAEAMGKRIGA